MSKWITDREPTDIDAPMDYIIVWSAWNVPFIIDYRDWHKRYPWMPIEKPEPYVAPKSRPKYFVMKDMFYKSLWAVYDRGKYVTGRMPTQEAAERIAAIYNEVMP